MIHHDFIDVDKITVEFTRAKPYNRIHLRRIMFGSATDYEITYDDLTATPYGTKLEKVKELRVVRTVYTKGTELKDLTSDKVTLKAGQQEEYEIEFGNAVHGLSVACLIEDEEKDFGARIVESGTYWCRVQITSPPPEDTEVILTIRDMSTTSARRWNPQN